MLKPRDEQRYQTGLQNFVNGNLEAAEVALRAISIAYPRFAEVQYNLGLVLRVRNKLRPALHCFRTAARIAPTFAEAHAALAGMLLRIGDEVEAEERARTAASLKPSLVFARTLLGDALRAQGRLKDARDAYDAVLNDEPNQPDARFGRAFVNLLENDFRQGLEDYEFRPSRRGPTVAALQPEWSGESLAGRTILAGSEQGLGDTIQFLRFIPRLAELGAKVLLAIPTSVASLASGLQGVQGIVDLTVDELPRFDFTCPLGTLPLRCGVMIDTIPGRHGYLTAPPERLVEWQQRLGVSSKPSIAIVWSGNPDHPNDGNRSLSPGDIAPLFRLPGVRWLNLQIRGGSIKFDCHPTSEIIGLGRHLRDFADTAAILSLADLVVTVDTSVCHLAGALGRPTWTLLPFAPDWRWPGDGSDSAWYATMRLFRQRAPRDWATVVADVSAHIRGEALGGC